MQVFDPDVSPAICICRLNDRTPKLDKKRRNFSDDDIDGDSDHSRKRQRTTDTLRSDTEDNLWTKKDPSSTTDDHHHRSDDVLNVSQEEEVQLGDSPENGPKGEDSERKPCIDQSGSNEANDASKATSRSTDDRLRK